MSLQRAYSCNLCGTIAPDQRGERRLIGLVWDMAAWVEAPIDKTDRHICRRCVSSIQALKPVCGGGIRGCTGGPRCTSDHA